jgi:hypothetical protein
MACNLNDLVRIKSLLDRKKLPSSPRIMELGSNDLNVQGKEDIALANELIAAISGGKGKTFTVDATPCAVPARQFYDCLGWEYYCLDVDRRPHTLHIDLNSGGFDARFKGYFDIVTNHGTTEHVMNPIASFFAIHELAKPGGIIVHDTPVLGMGNHGFLNLTPKFWHTMIFFNEYEVMEGRVREVDPKLFDAANFFLPHLGFLEGLQAIAYKVAIITVVLKKVGDRVYLPPLDMWPGMTGSVLGSMLYEATKFYLQTDLVTQDQLFASINRFLERSVLNKRMIPAQPLGFLEGIFCRLIRRMSAYRFVSAEGRESI